MLLGRPIRRSTSSLRRQLSTNNNGLAVAFGEIIFDRFVDTGESVIGGAPLNFALNLRQLAPPSSTVAVTSSLGRDELGEEARQLLGEAGLTDALVTESERRTGTVEVRLVDGQPEVSIIWWKLAMLCLI